MNDRSSGTAIPELRRRHMMVIGAVSAAGLMLSPTTSNAAGASGSTFVYVGSYTKERQVSPSVTITNIGATARPICSYFSTCTSLGVM
jgi:hypothetical protein